MERAKKQLKYTTLRDACFETCRVENLCQCICCLRWLDKTSVGCIEIKHGRPEVHDALKNGDLCSLLYHRQMALCQDSHIYMCFICEPSIKKVWAGSNDNSKKKNPSQFVSFALDVVLKGRFTKKNHFSVFKGCLCLCSTMNVDGALYRHQIRNAAFDVLEGLVIFFWEYSQKSSSVSMNNPCDIYRQRSRLEADTETLVKIRSMPDIMFVISYVRWRHIGFSNDVILPIQRSCTDVSLELKFLRKAVRMPFFSDKSNPGLRNSVCTCAVCMDQELIAEMMHYRRGTYAESVMPEFSSIRMYLNEGVSQRQMKSVPPHTLVCTKSDTIRLRSFNFYNSIMPPEGGLTLKYESAMVFYCSQFLLHELGQ